MKLTVDKAVEHIMNNEPPFDYKGVEYMICFPDGKFHCGIVDKPLEDKVFDSIEDVLNNWIIDGKNFKKIINEVNF